MSIQSLITITNARKAIPMISSEKQTLIQKFQDIVEGRVPGGLIAAVFNTAPFLNSIEGIPIKDYYMNSAVKMQTQLKFQDRFPELLCLPGVWADFGAILEPSALGCKIYWPEGGGVPTALPAVSSPSEFGRLKPANPQQNGLMPQALKDYEYMQQNLDPKYREKYGYLDGVAVSFGPVELGAVVMGHYEFFLHIESNSSAMHELFKITTESVINWLRACERMNSKLKRVILADHIPGQVNRDIVEEYFIPYTTQIINEFSSAKFIWHNEFPIPYLEAFTSMNFDVFHFGGELAPALANLGDKMVLMGNIDAMVLLRGQPKEVSALSRKCLEEGSQTKGFLLSAAGGVAPDTPLENIQVLLDEIRNFNNQKSKDD